MSSKVSVTSNGHFDAEHIEKKTDREEDRGYEQRNEDIHMGVEDEYSYLLEILMEETESFQEALRERG